jgi:hypothetical protein
MIEAKLSLIARIAFVRKSIIPNAIGNIFGGNQMQRIIRCKMVIVSLSPTKNLPIKHKECDFFIRPKTIRP